MLIQVQKKTREVELIYFKTHILKISTALTKNNLF